MLVNLPFTLVLDRLWSYLSSNLGKNLVKLASKSLEVLLLLTETYSSGVAMNRVFLSVGAIEIFVGFPGRRLG